jgi:hypothetical protein
MTVEVQPYRWFYKGRDGKRGPVSTEALLELLVKQAILAEDLVWRHGMETWKPASEVIELRAARFISSADKPTTPGRGLRRLVIPLASLAAALLVIVTIFSMPTRKPIKEPNSLRERLIAIGRSVDLESMPIVIDAIVNADQAIASTAVTVAEGLLGVRYSDNDRTNFKTLAGKVAADWKVTQDHLLRRRVGKELLAQ